ncbi:hypothetical protein HFD88_002266 [Aspergillus terreus]|nr:hypothetical protein HFD88_002266 [Aspergillus terreus]
MVVIHSVLHGVIAILCDDRPVQATRQHYVPFLVRYPLLFLEALAACSMILIVPMTLHAVVRRYPQLAMKCHYLLGAIGLAAMSYHVWMRRSESLWCLVAAAALWMFLSLISLAIPLRRRWGHAWPAVVVSRNDELLSIDITVPSGWNVEPGQYAYLWLPQAGLRIASQLALFYISSWVDTPGANGTGARAPGLGHLPGQRAQVDASAHSASHEGTLSEAETLVPDDASLRSAEQGEEWRQVGTGAERDAAVHNTSQRHGWRRRTAWNTAKGYRTLRVLARPQSSALATALYNAEHLHKTRHSALVLGPYGRPPDLAPFRIVLLIVEDIGIARVFSLIQTLVQASERHRAMVRKLIVVWQMEDLDNRRWVNMQHLLDLDRQEFKILRFVLYYRRNRNNESSRNPGTRIRFMEGSVDVAQTIRTYLNTRRGSMLVGVCARQLIRNQVQAIVQPKLSDDLRLLDLDVKLYHQ